MEYLISIIVPIYNVQNTLDKCVKSILMQTYNRLEIILVDDGSTDDCNRLCDEYEQFDSRIIVIHKKNGGLSEARNTGLKISKGKYVLYVDSDDYLELDACEKLISGIVEDDIDIVAGSYKEIRDNNIIIKSHTNVQERQPYNSEDFVIASIKNREWYAPAWLNMYNRDFLIRNNLFYKKGFLFEDLELLPKLFTSAKKVIYIDYPFYNYVIRPGSIMTSNNFIKKSNCMIAIYSEWFYVIATMDNKKYRRYLYAALVRYYLAAARLFKIEGWISEGLNFSFAIKYALGPKDKMKVILFSLFPSIYLSL